MPPTEEHGCGLAILDPRCAKRTRPERKLAAQLRRIVGSARPLAELARGVGIEVAVAAAYPAEGHVQVDAEVAGGVDRDVGRQRAVDRRGVTEREGGAHQTGVVYSGEMACRYPRNSSRRRRFTSAGTMR